MKRPIFSSWRAAGKRNRAISVSSAARGEKGQLSASASSRREAQPGGPCGFRKPSLSHRMSAAGSVLTQAPHPTHRPDRIMSPGLIGPGLGEGCIEVCARSLPEMLDSIPDLETVRSREQVVEKVLGRAFVDDAIACTEQG